MTLSIIIPVYNVEQYIRQCLESVFRQQLDESDFEVILVNDGTRDNSFTVIADIVDSHPNIKVVEQTNQGLSAARNTGISHASGQFVIFLDSDDLLVDNSLKPLLEIATDTHPDMLIADFVKMTDEEVASCTPAAFSPQPPASSHLTPLPSHSLFLTDFTPSQCFVWHTLYRKAFLDAAQLQFIPGIYFEDVPFTTACYLKAKTCIHCHHIFYIYRQRPGSIVSAINKRKVMDFNKVLEKLWEMRSEEIHPNAKEISSADIQRQLMNVIFTTFSVEMWYVTHHPQLLADRREIASDLRRRIPDLHFTGGVKQRLVSLLFRLMPSAYIRLRSLC